MSDGLSAEEKRSTRTALSRRARDFVTLVGCFSFILLLMWITGAVGLIEVIAAILVVVSVATAIFVGTASVLPLSPRLAVEPLSTTPKTPESAILLDALPLPAFEVDDDQRIVTMNEEAEFILRLDGRVNPRASTVIRSPGLLSAIENAIETGTVEPMTVEVESGPDETLARACFTSGPGQADACGA